MDHVYKASLVHVGFSRARLLELVVYFLLKDLSMQELNSQLPCIGRQIIYHEPPGKLYILS